MMHACLQNYKSPLMAHLIVTECYINTAAIIYHRIHLRDGFIVELTGQLKALANSSLLDSVPNTL